MRLDDRTTDGEPHAHAVLLCRKERLEEALGIIETRAIVANLDTDRVIALPAGPYPQRPRVVDYGIHGLDPVADQVHEDLLRLDAVEHDRRQIRFELHLDANAFR